MKLCPKAGCGRKIADDAKMCDECKAERGQAVSTDEHTHTTGYTAELDEQRKSGRWQRVRVKVIQRDPLCKRCGLAISEIGDHIVPAAVAVQQARDSGKYPFDKWAGYYLISNLQGLCRPCHGVKTLEDKAHVGPWPNVVEVEANAPRKVWSF